MSENSGTHQKLAAILAADAVGYSRLMAFDEPGTMIALDAARGVFRTQIELHHGRVVDMAGDSVLALFGTATGAVSAALAVQTRIEADLVGIPADRRMRFRIGVHLGDVIEKADGSVYGDGVNIAARLQTLAEPGGVTVSDAVQGAVRNRVAATFEDLGEQSVKNIADPVRVFRVVEANAGGAGSVRGAKTVASVAQRTSRRRWGVAALCMLLAGIGALAWYGQFGRVSSAAGGAASAQGAAPIAMSLAVGAFTAPSNDAVAEHAAEALRQDIATGLGAVERNLRVVSPSNSQQASTSNDFRERARRAGARYVVEGDVRMGPAQRVVSLRLIETEHGT